MAKSPVTTAWRNRIIGHGTEEPSQLLAHPSNWRLHPKNQQDALSGVLNEIGWIQSVIVNQRTGFVIDGHLRVALAISHREPEIPVVYVDLSDEEEALALASIDPISAMAATDKELLDNLLRDVSSADAGVQQMLSDLAEKNGLHFDGANPEPGEGGDDFDATPDDGPTRCQSGDLWLIGGKHRLLCGDSTNTEDVARLLDNNQVQAIFTSPPYDQQRDYEGKMAFNWLDLMTGVFSAVGSHLENDAQIFVNLGLIHREGRVIRYWDPFVSWMEQDGGPWPLFGWYVWDKLNGMPGNWNGRLGPAHEWIFHFARVGVQPKKTVETKGGHRTNGTQRQRDGSLKQMTQANAPIQPFKIPDSVVRTVQVNGARDYGDHPAPFPVTLPATFLNAYPCETWYEPFGGSGTTMVAAERAGRMSYNMEIVPKYADVILRRAEAEGLTVERLDTLDT